MTPPVPHRLFVDAGVPNPMRGQMRRRATEVPLGCLGSSLDRGAQVPSWLKKW